MGGVHLFVRESGCVAAPTVVFLHGGHLSGWSWTPVVERLPHYRCLIPDLPQFGRSCEPGAFAIGRSAQAVAALIRSRVGTGATYLVGYSLGAQVGVQLLAAEPALVDRAVLCGPSVNVLPSVRVTQKTLGRLARTSWLRELVKRYWDTHASRTGLADIDDYQRDMQIATGTRLADIVEASVGFTIPAGLDKVDTPTLFLSGAREWPMIRRSSAVLARSMTNGSHRLAAGLGHDWPLRDPDLFAHTINSWFSQAPMPTPIVQAGHRGERPAAL